MALTRKNDVASSYRELIAAEHALDTAQQLSLLDISMHEARVAAAHARYRQARGLSALVDVPHSAEGLRAG